MYSLASFRLLLLFASVFCLTLLPQALHAQRLRVVSYNIEDGPVSATKDAAFRTIIEAVGNLEIQGETRPIDLLGFQEGPENASEYADIEANFETVFPGDYEASISSADFFGCRTGFIYNTDVLQLINATTLSAGLTHRTRRVRFRPVGGTSADDFYAYSVHLKAGESSADETEREMEASIIRNDFENLPGDLQVIYLGDFNLKGSDEPAWQTLIAPGENSSAIDSINTPFGIRGDISWNDNLALQPFHTQDPGPNMDDRFDAILFNGRLIDGVGMEYVVGSVQSLGNNGTHTMGQGINTGNGATGFGSELASFSDHVPVVCDFELHVGKFSSNDSIATEAVFSRTVRQSGPVSGDGDNLQAEGSGNGNFAAFGVIDFQLDTSGAAADAINSSLLTMFQANAPFSENGPISIYVTTAEAASVPIDSSIQYQTGQNGLQCVPALLSSGAMKAALFPAVHRSGSGGILPNGTFDTIVLYGPEFQQAVVDSLNGNGQLRLLVVPDEADTAATFAGFSSNLGAPEFSAEVRRESGEAIAPSQFNVIAGMNAGGSLKSLQVSDDDRLKLLCQPPAEPGDLLLQATFSANVSTPMPGSLSVEIERSANSIGLRQTLELFNFATGIWEEIDSGPLPISEEAASIEVAGDPSRFVSSGNVTLARLTIDAEAPVFQFPWAIEINRFGWLVGQ